MVEPATWMVTGASGGLGQALVMVLLSRGIPVVATARNPDSLRSLQEAGATTAKWDVTAPLELLQESARSIDEKAGGIAVLVNNAGQVVGGTLEETTPADTQLQFNTNVFGPLNTTRAFLPLFRKRRRGFIVNVSSMAGIEAGPGTGLYCASKFALEGLTESLRAEVAHLGINVVAVEPGLFRTSILDKSPSVKGKIEDYWHVTGPKQEQLEGNSGRQRGDPEKGMALLVDAVLGEAGFSGQELPGRLPLGGDAVAVIKRKGESLLKLTEDLGPICSTTDGEWTKA
ncbi:NAD(P)-binding protein [Meredithblackwellia eburnea MCA 4105]